ncbi:sulfatase family protein [Croceivirga sp. JEA036]|uniref:sulfatase family protein n=1 Tax=Croceivirga sp. JEA036 TaxID=2721162 RepID=UPI001438E78A|nr:arylsulfatase [Croceivirga sp. JEA036]NJB35212.1 arylsulfatase [Croceivirga sp. JEA036]
MSLKLRISILFFALSFATNAQEKPNVIVILADDLGLGDLSFYRKKHTANIILETPALDYLAENGVAFTNAHAPASLCAPSRYAIMTGNHCYRSEYPWGVWGSYQKSPIKNDQLTLGKLMQNAGYHTGFFGKWHLGGDFKRKSNPTTIYRGPRNKPQLDIDITKIMGGGPSYQGFDYSLTFMAGIQDVPYAVFENSDYLPLASDSEITFITQKKMDKLGVTLDKDEGLGDSHWNPHKMGPLLINKALDYIDAQADKEKPFFMYYSSLAVHLPHTPAAFLNGVKVANTTPSKHLDMVKELDIQIEMLLSKLREKQLLDNTLILLTSDNGGLLIRNTLASGHQPSDIYRGGKNQAYEGGNRVPFIAFWPSKITPRVDKNPVLGLDIMGTLAGLTQQELPKNQALDSENLLPILLKNADGNAKRTIITQAGTGKEVMITQEGFKLIIQVDKKDKTNTTRYPIALFNLNNNPTENEVKNLIHQTEYKEKVAALLQQYNQLRDTKTATRS